MPAVLLAPGERHAGVVSEALLRSWLPFCKALPKAELHAHINGSVRDETLRRAGGAPHRVPLLVLTLTCGPFSELAAARADDEAVQRDAYRLLHRGERSLADCFALFDLIHRLTTRHALVTRITREVVADAADDNVLYLELRTTPKVNPAEGMTKRSYVEAVLEGARHELLLQRAAAPQRPGVPAGIDTAVCGAGGGDGSGRITVRLLLSIDRREGADGAMETVDLASELRGRGIVGVDLSGNPSLGTWSTWEPALCRARQLGLPLTLHCGEVDNEQEVRAMLSFAPERLGHAVTAAADEDLLPALLGSGIPVELCLTSNVLSQSVPSYGAHHFSELCAAGHPVSLCTDDSAVFHTCLSREYALAAAAFQLDAHALWALAEAGVAHAFAPPPVKALLMAQLRARRAAAGG